MFRLRMFVFIGFIGIILGLGLFLTGVRDERSMGLLLFIAGVIFLVAGLAGQSVVEELKREAEALKKVVYQLEPFSRRP
jgi:hypothetical protein